jgi:hypothetical protein
MCSCLCQSVSFCLLCLSEFCLLSHQSLRVILSLMVFASCLINSAVNLLVSCVLMLSLVIQLVCLSLILTRTARGSDGGQVYLPVAGPILPTHPQLSQSLVGPDLPAPAVRPSSLAGAGGDATPWLNGAALVHFNHHH